MENMKGYWEQKGLINELKHGRELGMQLQLLLTVPSSSLESREILVQKILASYQKSLSIVTCSNSTMAAEQTLTAATARAVDSPTPSLTGSPRSEDSDRDFKEQKLRDMSKRRKIMPRWTQSVRVSPGTALEGPLDDGFSWRKYGQKDILGAKYPRGYYRCTHRKVQGCLATKQVQRSDEDPSIFEITYRGRHTCTQASCINQPPLGEAAVAAPVNQEQNTNTQHPPQQSPDLLQNFQRGLKVVTKDLDIQEHQPYKSSFPFPSPSSSTAQDNYFSVINNQVMGEFSSFISPAASGTSGYNFTESPNGRAEMKHEIISVTSSAAASPTVGFGFPFGSIEFDPGFTFDNPGFFS